MKRSFVFVVAFAVLMVALFSFAQARECNPRVIPPNANAFGKSYSEWGALWWKWQLGLPATDHPAFDTDGTKCGAGQSGKVFFLTGTQVNEVPDNLLATVVRESCIVPTGKAIFFPILNIECSTVEAEPFHGETTDELLKCAKSFIEGPNAVARDLSVTIDGRDLKNLEAYRFQSLATFKFQEPNDNILGVDCDLEDCENMQLGSDGFWIMLPPLSKGEHTIRFTGSFKDATTEELFFGLDITYILTVGGAMP
jgi:hypothetical protein